MAVSDVFVGALTSGVNKSTWIVINITCLATILALLGLLITSWSTRPHLTVHVGVLLFLASGLWGAINWFIFNIGTVDVEQQNDELFGTGSQEGSSKNKEE